MSWSFAAGLLTSVLSVASVIALWNEWCRDTSQLTFYKNRYRIRDLQLDSTLTLYDALVKQSKALYTENITQSEKIGELEIELSLTNGRVQQMTELYSQEQRRADALQAELDEMFKPENFV